MKNMLKRIACLTFCLFGMLAVSFAQTGTVKGKVIDEINQPIPLAQLVVLDSDFAPFRADNDGRYEVKLPSGENGVLYRIKVSHPAYKTAIIEVRVRKGLTAEQNVKMLTRQVDVTDITAQQELTDFTDDVQMEILPIELKDVSKLPIAAPSIERVIATLTAGSRNEFSSQYRVRGGNFDENLVYVNGIEIYRPFLIRSGQQEGLGFTNPSMASDVRFSTGGFQAKYGDKMSSVLDVTYTKPSEFRATAEVGIITTNLHVQGTSKSKDDTRNAGRFTYNIGARRFAATYLLNSLDVQGNYRPNFYDGQAFFTYTPKSKKKGPKIVENADGGLDTLYIYPTDRLQISTFLAFSRNSYLFEPEGRTTTFGTIQQAFSLFVAFEGRERTAYTTGLGALMVTHRPTTRLRLDYIVTAFNAQESEIFTVEGGYRLSDINVNFGSDEFGESVFDRGIGTEFRYARNYLNSNVISGQFKGEWRPAGSRKHKLYFGSKYEYRLIDDQLKEYSLIDSAGYVIDSTGGFGRVEYIFGEAQLESNTIKAYLQHQWNITPFIQLVTGGRAVYYDLIDEWMLSPRVQFVFDGSKLSENDSVKRDFRIRLAGGLYQQPPFYREFRRFDGTLNLDLKPQISAHLILGGDYRFNIWNRPFKLFTEAYYKRLYNLIPYEIENVRVRYYPDRIADGYAVGVDARLSGEFIRGVDSWVSIGVLKTMEDVEGDGRGYLPRPTDQRLSFSMYFQDELPINPTYKVHLNYVYSSGLRFGPPRVFQNRTAFSFPSYHRVDLGFSKLITFKTMDERTRKRGVESIWATVEIFNLFQRANTVSYTWVQDVYDVQFAVPDFLSARLLNFRLVMRFN